MESLHHTEAALRHALDTGNIDRAWQLLHQLLDIVPDYADGHRLLGEAHLQRQQYPEAIAAFDRTLLANPEHVDALYGLGVAHYSLGQVDQAHAAWERALDIEPTLGETRTLLQQIHFTRRSDRSEQLSQIGLARLYLRSNMYEQAIDVLRNVLAQHPERTDAAVALAEALWRANRVAETQRLCYEILALRPYLLKPTLLLAYILIERGEPGGESLWQRALSQDPFNVMAQTLFKNLPAITFDPACQHRARTPHCRVQQPLKAAQGEQHEESATTDDQALLRDTIVRIIGQIREESATMDDQALLLQLLTTVPSESEDLQDVALHEHEEVLYEMAVNGTTAQVVPTPQPNGARVDTVPELSPILAREPDDSAATALRDLEEMLAQANVEPVRATLHLAVARLAWQTDPGRALTLYKQLIKDGVMLDEAIDDLQEYTETVADVDVRRRAYRLLGDAFMHQCRLADATKAYGRAFPALLAAPSAG